MKLCVKKVYCGNCRRLVRAREQGDDHRVQILCPRCGKLIYFWDGVTWRYP